MTATDDLKNTVAATTVNADAVQAAAETVQTKAEAVTAAAHALSRAHEEFRAALVEMVSAAGAPPS